MKLSEYSKLDATALAALIRQKEISPKEALDTALEALRQVNGRLNAVVDYTYDYGLKQIDKGIDYEAPFCGVPFVLKDCGGEAAGIRATMGTRLTGKGVYAGEDSTLFKRMKKAGVIVAATAATSELCIDSSTETIRNGPTRNPWNTEFSPGVQRRFRSPGCGRGRTDGSWKRRRRIHTDPCLHVWNRGI